MLNGSIAIVVGASAEEFDHVKQCLSYWKCVLAPSNDEKTRVSSLPTTEKVIVVYAQKEQKNTQAICEHLQNSAENSATPTLPVIGRYEISQANAIKRMGDATFIVTPFNEKELRDRIMQMKRELRSDGTNGN